MSTQQRPAIDLSMVGIRPGDILCLRTDQAKTCIVVQPHADPVPIVAYGGELLSLTAAAARAMEADDANGPRDWMFGEQIISDRRDAFREWHLR